MSATPPTLTTGPEGRPGCHPAQRAVALLGAVAGLSATASACPYCSLSQGTDTLMYIMGFLVIPYLVVSGILFWMKRVLATEHEDAG